VSISKANIFSVSQQQQQQQQQKKKQPLREDGFKSARDYFRRTETLVEVVGIELMMEVGEICHSWFGLVWFLSFPVILSRNSENLECSAFNLNMCSILKGVNSQYSIILDYPLYNMLSYTYLIPSPAAHTFIYTYISTQCL
jgi:hypothetical protein